MSESQIEICPACGSSMPVISGYVTWCEQCDWNIHPKWFKNDSLSLFERFHYRLGIRSADLLYKEISDTPAFSYPVTIGTIGAYLFSVLLHATSIGIVYLAIRNTFWPELLGDFLIGLLLLAISFILFWPTRTKIPGMKLHRSEYPSLYRLLDEITNCLKAPKVDVIFVNYDFNAFATRTGIRPRTVVGIGLPLFSVLDLQEKVAILAHEMGHHANRDMTRKLIVRKAMQTLGAWYEFLFPKTDYSELFGPFYYIFSFIRRRLADIIYYAYYLLGLSVWKQSQRSEYFADLASARILQLCIAFKI